MLVLNTLFFERRIDSPQAGQLIQKGISQARSVLESLRERGLIEARGEKRGRVYHLAAALYRRLGAVPGYVRTRGFDRIRQQGGLTIRASPIAMVIGVGTTRWAAAPCLR